MQQGMSTETHQFGPVPGQEGSRCLAHLCRMRHHPKANRAPLPLIAQRPIEAKQANRKGGDQLDIYRRCGVERRATVGEVKRTKVDDGQNQRDLGAQEAPALEPL